MKIRKFLYLLIMVSFIYGGYRYIQYKNSNQYKLKEVGYSKEEITIITEKSNEDTINFLLENDYSDQVMPIIKEKYFVEEKLEAYLKYKADNKERNLSDVISIVNAGADKEFYTNIKKTDTSKDNLILVNKFYALDQNYVVDDLVPISLQYAYDGHSIKREVLDNFLDMWHAADKLGLSLIINSSYRDHEFQSELYNNYSNTHGQAEADTFSARPGHSEHQTGLALDISAYGSILDDFGQTEEYEWTKDNAHLYGFILRYPENKEHITGYIFEPWHYRYVGKEVAKKIYEMDITFDEYYELYIK